ncbi:hypothetical protein ACVNPX_02070 [Staphylococcus aureus]
MQKLQTDQQMAGSSWSDYHKSLIYRYDATLGTQITTNDILTMLKATTTVPGSRNNIAT